MIKGKQTKGYAARANTPPAVTHNPHSPLAPLDPGKRERDVEALKKMQAGLPKGPPGRIKVKKHTCAFRPEHDPDTLEPRGPVCGERATQEIHWKDGRVSPSCPKHGLDALDEGARELVLRVTTPETEDQWATEG